MTRNSLNGAIAFVLVLSSSLIGFVRSEEMTLVEDGKPMTSIVLPAETEFDRYMAEKEESLEETLREENSELDEKAFARLRKRSMAKLQSLAKSPGDEEELAAEELQSIVENISGAKLPILRVETPDAPKGPAVFLGTELARRAGLGSGLMRSTRMDCFAWSRAIPFSLQAIVPAERFTLSMNS